MKTYFPPELIVYSSEAHFSHHNRKMRIIYVLVVFLLVVLITCLPLVSVRITRQSYGIIRTPRESNQIQTSMIGLVKSIDMREGQKVFKGDTLIQFDTGLLEEQIILYSSQIDENEKFIADIERLLSDREKPVLKRYQLEQLQYKAKESEYHINIQILEKEFLVAKQLYEENVTHEMDFVQKKSKYEAATSQLNVFVKQSINQWQQELTRLQQENRSLQSNLCQLKKECEHYIITAPISGELGQVKGIQAGSFINPGQILATISPDDKLIAECYLPPKDIGFIKPGQQVRLHFDSFNYNEWGLIIGVVKSVSDDIVMINNQPVFKVRCELPVNYLQLKSGHKGYLRKGMTLTGRFVVARRSLYQLLFDTVDDWLNPNLVKND